MTRGDALGGYRREFVEHARYLNYASWGPISRAARRAADEVAETVETGAPGAVAAITAAPARAAEAFGRLSGFPPDQVILVPSTSHGLVHVALGLAEGRVLVGAGEFPANLQPWWNAGRAGGVRPHVLDAPDGVTPELLAAHLGADHTAVAISAVDYRTGARADLTAIRDVIGPDRLLVVDAIQGLGVVTENWSAADVVVAGAQKWIRAGWGVAGMALSELALERVRPTASSWAGFTAPSSPSTRPGEVRPGAAGHVVTNPSPTAAAAFAAGLGLVETAGVATLERAIDRTAARLRESVPAAGVVPLSRGGTGSGIVPLRIPASRADAIRRALDAEGFTVTWHGPDRIRVSIHATTADSTIDALVDTLARAQRDTPEVIPGIR